MATTTMHPMPARPMGSMDRVISITASFWAWARGPAGAITTAGAAIASAMVAAEGITAEAVSQPIVDTAVVDLADTQVVDLMDTQAVHRQYATAVVELEPPRVTPRVEHLVAEHPTPKRLAVAEHPTLQ
jgi:hypothetical protein